METCTFGSLGEVDVWQGESAVVIYFFANSRRGTALADLNSFPTSIGTNDRGTDQDEGQARQQGKGTKG